MKVENYDIKVDEASSTITYIGKAARGSATSASVWQIKRVNTETLAAEIDWAENTDRFDKIWDNRGSYSY